jgi:hypothetical protein
LIATPFLVLFGLAFTHVTPGSAATGNGCNIPRGGDADGNGIGDVGVQVVCNYEAFYAEDASGAYYWDLGDGRVQTSAGVTSVEDLDQSTLTNCYYQIHTKGTFENDPFQDSGVISNMIRCSGYAGTSTYNYQIVHETDPRYRGNPEMAVWGNWEYHVYTVSGEGNLARPAGPVA